MKIIKLLHQWPLSKVELIEDNGKKILKTVHRDFIGEAYKQRFLEKHCNRTNIPRVLSIDKKRSSFVMEYLPQSRKISKEKSLKLIQEFHNETRNIKSNY